MKRLKLIGLSLLAVFALGVFAAASASAEEGFLVGGSGTPTTANILGGLSILETEAAEIHCALLDETPVTFINDKHATAVLRWLKCTAAKKLFSAQSLGAKAGEVLVEVLFLVCLKPTGSGTDEYGVSAEVAGTAHFEVPSVGQLLEAKGALLGAVLTTGKATLFNVEFLGSKGKQTVTECFEGKEVKKHTFEISTNHEAFKKASKRVEGGLIQFPETTELME